MKIKSVLASVAACAIAISAMAISASADVDYDLSKLEAGDGNYTCYIFGDKEDGSITGMVTDAADLAKITAIKWTVECETASDPANWYGGAFGINTKTGGWDAPQWCINEENPEKTTPTKINDTTYELTREVSLASSGDFAQAVFQIYGDNASKTHLKSVTLVGLDAPAADTTAAATTTTSAAAAATTTTSAAAGTTTTAAATTTTSGAAQPAGDAGVAVVAATLALAGAAAFVARKKD